MNVDLEAIARYHRDGYLQVEQLFTPEEVAIMLDAVGGERVTSTSWDSVDASGRAARLALWSDIADDVWGAVSTSPRIVNTIRILQGEDISFFHGKVMLKTANSGGAFEWHQDYGYWYDQGFLFPRMMSAFVALDHCTIDNGCLEVLRGSHKLGRLNHGSVGSQTGVNEERLKQVKPFLEHVHCVMSPGTALFFDCNLIHGSAPNLSPNHRRSFIMCYNAQSNPTVWENPHLSRVPCPVSADNAILNFAHSKA
jgi:ectoine hydroxylase